MVEWAESSGKVIGFSHIEQFRRVAEGAEHVVYHDPQRGLAVKATHANRFGHSTLGEGVPATPVEYLQRLAWQNQIFGDDIRIEGIASDESQIEVVTTQPWITSHFQFPTPTLDEIDAYFRTYSFVKVCLTPDVPLYFHPQGGLLIADAHERNILRTETGVLAPIDVVIGHPGADLLRQIQSKLKL